jgi:hypothetical protein
MFLLSIPPHRFHWVHQPFLKQQVSKASSHSQCCRKDNLFPKLLCMSNNQHGSAGKNPLNNKIHQDIPNLMEVKYWRSVIENDKFTSKIDCIGRAVRHKCSCSQISIQTISTKRDLIMIIVHGSTVTGHAIIFCRTPCITSCTIIMANICPVYSSNSNQTQQK